MSAMVEPDATFYLLFEMDWRLQWGFLVGFCVALCFSAGSKALAWPQRECLGAHPAQAGSWFRDGEATGSCSLADVFFFFFQLRSTVFVEVVVDSLEEVSRGKLFSLLPGLAPYWLLWLAALPHIYATVRLNWVGCMHSRFEGQSVGDLLWLRWARWWPWKFDGQHTNQTPSVGPALLATSTASQGAEDV